MEFHLLFLFIFRVLRGSIFLSNLLKTSSVPEVSPLIRLQVRACCHIKLNSQVRFSRAVIKWRGLGISPVERGPRLFSKENRRKRNPYMQLFDSLPTNCIYAATLNLSDHLELVSVVAFRLSWNAEYKKHTSCMMHLIPF